MFNFAIGLLLPSAQICEDLKAKRPECWEDLLLELRREFDAATNGNGPTVCFWWCCIDLGTAPISLEQELLQLCKEKPHVQYLGFHNKVLDLENWLIRSGVVLQMQYPDSPFSQEILCASDLISKRFANCPPCFTTRIQKLRLHSDGVEGWAEFRGNQLQNKLIRNQKTPFHPYWEQKKLLESFTAAPGRTERRTTESARWAQQRGLHMQRVSNRTLSIQAAVMGCLVIAAQGISETLITPLLVLIAGTWWINRNPFLMRAQQWLCLSEGFWVQDLWYNFGLSISSAAELPKKQPLNGSDDQGAMVGLLLSHEVWLELQPPIDNWNRSVLVDCDRLIAQHQSTIHNLIKNHLMRRRVQGILAIMAMIMALVHLMMPAEFWPLSLLLLSTIGLLTLRIGSPLPLVNLERLLRHDAELQGQRRLLERALAADNLAEPNLRTSVLTAVRRLGEEVLDLCRDGLIAAGSRRRWQL